MLSTNRELSPFLRNKQPCYQFDPEDFAQSDPLRFVSEPTSFIPHVFRACFVPRVVEDSQPIYNDVDMYASQVRALRMRGLATLLEHNDPSIRGNVGVIGRVISNTLFVSNPDGSRSAQCLFILGNNPRGWAAFEYIMNGVLKECSLLSVVIAGQAASVAYELSLVVKGRRAGSFIRPELGLQGLTPAEVRDWMQRHGPAIGPGAIVVLCRSYNSLKHTL